MSLMQANKEKSYKKQRITSFHAVDFCNALNQLKFQFIQPKVLPAIKLTSILSESTCALSIGHRDTKHRSGETLT